ncbi:manganese efflux pump MntP family protein [Desulfosporosinus meridiei]|uniref:Putative manganese efflux pump MntP n=1 Tax=Desulfosporosinus meridiei (strain ATCC BAA-275 / DSM 13257 / KCTC 12902 / NCIMB 13706 / S10) TaxID=768704 RepID=J7J632_DESMD|nr:manganese efflux pump MntP family protein [Desulfosporosinus meridiei]AFQ46376.1 putative membrane protein [Desulfosporosinus meridiei DSM 13257]
MNFLWVVAVATALGADAFSLALAIGLAGIRKSMMVRLALVVAVFHVFMPLGGMMLGQALGSILGQFASLAGAFVLIVLGVRMLYKIYWPAKQSLPFGEARQAFFAGNITNQSSLEGYGIYLLAASVSLDALSVGFSLGTIRADILMTVLIMGMIAGLMTGIGLVLGRVMGTRLGDRAELFGGLALLLIGIKLLF